MADKSDCCRRECIEGRRPLAKYAKLIGVMSRPGNGGKIPFAGAFLVAKRACAKPEVEVVLRFKGHPAAVVDNARALSSEGG